MCTPVRTSLIGTATMIVSVFTLLFLFLTAFAVNNVQRQENLDNDIISCVLNIIEENVNRRTVVFFVEEEQNSSLWMKIIRGMKKPFMVISHDLQMHDTDRLLIVLYPKPNTKYSPQFQKLRKDTRYVIVASEEFNWYHMTNILEQFHDMKMIYDVLLLPFDGTINIYTSFPYSENHCGEAGPPTKIDSCVNGTHHSDLFYTEKYWDMYGCTLTCLGNRQPPDSILALNQNGEIVFQGFAKEIMNILSEQLNFKPKIILPRGNNSSLERSWFFYNDTVDQITNYLGNEQVDFAMGVFSRLAFTNESAITFGKETRFECYTWAVPIRAGKKRSIIMNYIDEFSFSFWLLFIISMIVAVFIIVSITTILGEHSRLQSPLNAFIYLFGTILNQPIPINPKPWSLRLFIAFWLLYILVMSTAYQASLWSFMTIPWQVHNIRSLQDLLDSNLEIKGAQQMLNILSSIKSNNENVKTMIKKLQVLPVSDFKDVIRNIETQRDFAVFGEKRHLSSYSKDMNKIFDKDRVYFVDGCLMQSLMTLLLFPRGSPLYEPINTVLIHLIQNGLVQKFSAFPSDDVEFELVRETINHETGIPKQSEQMTIAQCRGIFFILIMGYGISFVAFVCEISVANMSDKLRKVNIIIGPKLYYRDHPI